MARPSKRAKRAAESMSDSPLPSGAPALSHSNFIPFQIGPSLERIPDDVLHEILSHLPTLHDDHSWFVVVRMTTLRALSWTSRLLRSRCLARAWRSVGFFGTIIPKYNIAFFKVICEATKTNMRVLKACSHLRPLIQTASVIMTRYQSDRLVPALAACLATLPNLTTIQVVHAHSQMTTAIKFGFRSKRFPSVRRISLPSSAHEIIKSCPNVEEVTCTQGNGSTIVGSIVKGNCRRVRVLKDVSAPLARLVKFLPELQHVSLGMGCNIKALAAFPALDTIEIVIPYRNRISGDISLKKYATADVKEASDILKGNASQSKKAVIVTKWKPAWEAAKFEFDADKGYMGKEVVNV